MVDANKIKRTEILSNLWSSDGYFLVPGGLCSLHNLSTKFTLYHWYFEENDIIKIKVDFEKNKFQFFYNDNWNSAVEIKFDRNIFKKIFFAIGIGYVSDDCLIEVYVACANLNEYLHHLQQKKKREFPIKSDLN